MKFDQDNIKLTQQASWRLRCLIPSEPGTHVWTLLPFLAPHHVEPASWVSGLPLSSGLRRQSRLLTYNNDRNDVIFVSKSSKSLSGRINLSEHMMVDQNSFIRERPFFANKQFFCESFANPMFIFRGTHVEQQLLLWRLFHRLPNHTKSRITSS